MPTDEQPPRKSPAANVDGIVKSITPRLNAVSRVAAESVSKSVSPSLDALTKSVSQRVIKAATPNLSTLSKLAIGRTNVMRDVLPSPTLSADFHRWQAEKQAAPVVTRDAVLALGDSVESLIAANETSSTILIALTVRIIRLTVVLVVIGVLSLGLTAYLVFS